MAEDAKNAETAGRLNLLGCASSLVLVLSPTCSRALIPEGSAAGAVGGSCGRVHCRSNGPTYGTDKPHALAKVHARLVPLDLMETPGDVGEGLVDLSLGPRGAARQSWWPKPSNESSRAV